MFYSHAEKTAHLYAMAKYPSHHPKDLNHPPSGLHREKSDTTMGSRQSQHGGLQGRSYNLSPGLSPFNGILFVCFVLLVISSVQFSSVAQSCPTLCEPMNRSTLGLLVHHQLPEFTQTHFHRVRDAISSSVVPFSSCPQSLPASESFPMSQLFS